HGVAAECAPVAPGRYHGPPELGIANAASNRRLHFQTDSAGDFPVQRFGEMSVKKLAGDFTDRLGPALQFVEDRRWKPARNSEFPEFRPQKILAPQPSGERHALLNFPDSISLQVEERELGVRGFSRRPKLLQQPFERPLQLVERDQPFRAGLNL